MSSGKRAAVAADGRASDGGAGSPPGHFVPACGARGARVLCAANAQLLSVDVTAGAVRAHGAPGADGATLRFVCRHPTLPLVACGGDGKTVFLLEERDGELTALRSRAVSSNKKLTCGAFTCDGSLLAVGDRFGDVTFLSVPELKESMELCHMAQTTAVLSTPTHVISTDAEAKVRVSKYPNVFDIERFVMGHDDAIMNAALLPNGRLVTCDYDGYAGVWDPVSGERLAYARVGGADGVVCSRVVPNESGSVIAATLHPFQGVRLLRAADLGAAREVALPRAPSAMWWLDDATLVVVMRAEADDAAADGVRACTVRADTGEVGALDALGAALSGACARDVFALDFAAEYSVQQAAIRARVQHLDERQQAILAARKERKEEKQKMKKQRRKEKEGKEADGGGDDDE